MISLDYLDHRGHGLNSTVPRLLLCLLCKAQAMLQSLGNCANLLSRVAPSSCLNHTFTSLHVAYYERELATILHDGLPRPAME